MPATTIGIRWLFPATDQGFFQMSFFRNVVFLAAAAGLLAGLSLAVMQSFATVPLILEAENYENAGAPAHDHGAAIEQAAPAASDSGAVQSAATAHVHAEELAVDREDGSPRHALVHVEGVVERRAGAV